jgi:hypothetical protein
MGAGLNARSPLGAVIRGRRDEFDPGTGSDSHAMTFLVTGHKAAKILWVWLVWSEGQALSVYWLWLCRGRGFARDERPGHASPGWRMMRL